MGTTVEGVGLGWLPDHPDFRDHHVSHGKAPTGEKRDVPALLSELGVAEPLASLPAQVDLRPGFSPIEDQSKIGSCTAHAGVGLLEYFEKTATGNHIDASRLFLYKATRNLMQQTGDTGSFLRTTMQAMVLFGVPPEQYWPYDIASFDVEPTAFCYSFGQNYKAVQYYRLDPPDVTDKEELIARIKTNLHAGLPAMFGFTVFSSFGDAAHTGAFPYPTPLDHRAGGHAIIACGYDDAKRIKGTGPHAVETVGAFRLRNSWGVGWGEGGYGWLPYEYVRTGLAQDWWSLIKSDWVDTGVFGLKA
jgi:C1A family cysteine protease